MKLLKTNFHIIIGLITVLTIICKKCSNTIRTVKEDTSLALPKIDNADDVCRYAIGTLGLSCQPSYNFSSVKFMKLLML